MKKLQSVATASPNSTVEEASDQSLPGLQANSPVSTSAPEISSYTPFSSFVCISAVLLAFVGQDLLSETHLLGASAAFKNPVDAGILLSLLAALLFGCAAPRLPEICAPRPLKSALASQPRLWLKIACAFSVTASIALLAASNYLHVYERTTSELEVRLAWYLSWLAFAVSVFLLARLQRNNPAGESSPPFTRREAVTFAGIVLLALAIRCYDLIDTPHTVNTDNAIAMLSAYKNVSPDSWLRPGLGEHGAATLAFSFFSIATWLVGPGILANRLPEVLLGTGMVAAGYLFVWRAFDSHRLAAFTALVMATYAPLVHFSRHVMNIDPWACSLLGFVFLVHGLRSHRVWAMTAAGFFIGFSLQLYISIRSLVLTAPFLLAYLAIHRPLLISKSLTGWLLFCFGGLVSFGANLSDLYVNYEPWVMSNRPGSWFINVENLHGFMQSEHQTSIPAFALEQLKRAFLMFQVIGDKSGQMRGSEALFSLFIAPFVWLGLGTLCASWSRNLGAAALLLVAAVNIAVGQLMWSNIAYWPKLIIVMFVGCLCVALALLRTCDAIRALIAAGIRTLGASPQRADAVLRPILLAGALSLLIVSVVIDLGRYFVVARVPFSAPEVAGRYIMSLPENVTVCSRHQVNVIHVDKVELMFYGYGRNMIDFGKTPMPEASTMCGPRPFAWLITPDQTDLRDRLKALYPDGTLEEHLYTDGGNLFWSYYVP